MLLVTGFVLLALAALLDLPRWPGRTAQLAWLACTAAAVVLAVAGALGLTDRVSTVDLGSLGGLGTAALTVDRLSGLFLLVCFGTAAMVLLAATGLIASMVRPRLAASVALSLAAVAVVITAQNVFVFLFGWEALTLAFYLLSGHDRRLSGRGRASMLAGGFGKVSGALLMLGFLLLAAEAHSFDFAALTSVRDGSMWAAGYVLLLLGFGTKVGWVPVQIWLPPAYAAAPGPARPVMAAVAVNVGFYGMWRTLELLGAPPMWLAVVVLVIAGITAILGIAHAAVHPDLAYLVAWSSVENAGVITAGYGAALVGAVAQNDKLVAVGLLAGTLQIIAHAVGKATLFVATAAAEQELATTELDRLRGVARRLPWTGLGLVVGSLTLAGLPLTAGFASEWFTLESLMQQFRIDGTSMKLATAFAGALVALTIGVAGVTFVRLVSLTAFGHPSAPDTILHRPERRVLLRLGTGALVVGCIGLSVVAPLEIRVIGAGLAQISGGLDSDAVPSPWVLQPVFADFSALSPTWLAIVLPLMFLVIALVTVLVSRGRLLRLRRVPAWTSASVGVGRQTQYTSFGYANPMRKVLANLLRTRSRLQVSALPTSSSGRPLPAFATVSTPTGIVAAQALGGYSAEDVAAGGAGANPEPPLDYQVDVVEVVEQYVYHPLSRALFAVVRQAKRLQSGRLDAYMTYMLIAVVAVLAIVAATA
jgi:formate hydrogenlyase subunit 3/multisubunit Na+/H+ antiporter MnhD subunit